MTPPKPPRLARLVLRLMLHPDDRDCALSDLDEEFDARCRAGGVAHARRWYRQQARQSLWPAMGQRIREGPGALHPSRAAFFAGLGSDARLALRRLSARPVASLGAVATLACSVGAAAATWSLLSAALLRPLPVAAPDRLVVVGVRDESTRSLTVDDTHLYPAYDAIRTADAFDGLAAGGSAAGPMLVAADGPAQPRSVFFASHDYFSTLGVSPTLGRGFREDDDRRGAALVAILASRFWQSESAGRRDAIGRAIAVNGRPVIVIGVAPRGFRGLNLQDAPDVYLPLHTILDVIGFPMNAFAEPNTGYSPTSWLTVVGRLKPGVTSRQTADRLSALALPNLGPNVVLTGVNTAAIPEAARPDLTRFARLLAVAVCLLLLVGCLTVGTMLLARTEARRGELAMCLALGASRARLARGVVLEGAWLCLLATLLALPIANALFGAVQTFQLPGRISLDLLDLSIDGRVVLGAASAATLAILVVALAAAAFGLSVHVVEFLRAQPGETRRSAQRRARGALLVTQVAIALVLVSGAGLFARSLMRALSLNPGYDTSRLITVDVGLAPHGYDANRATAFFDELSRALAAHPTVRSVGFASWQGAMGGGGRLTIDGEPRRMPSLTDFTGIDERYFPTMGLRVVRGRNFLPTDTAVAPLVGIVSESLGRFVANGGDPLGHRIAEFFSSKGKPPNTIEIVGVVPDVVTRIRTLEPLVLYRPMSQLRPDTSRTVLVRAAGRPGTTAREVLSTIEDLDLNVRTTPVRTLDERMLEQMQPQRLGMRVLSALGGLALLLAVTGTAVLAETMAVTRRREMGIRAALGASRRQLARLIVSDTIRLIAIGVAAGVGLAWILADTVRALLYQTAPLDPTTLTLAAGTIVVLALTVSVRPALLAARVDLARLIREP